MSDWDQYFSDIMNVVKSKSKDPSRQVGCVIVGPSKEIRSTGFNDMPRGVFHTEGRYQKPEKYFWCEHAERNALYNAARAGIATDGCTAYVTMYPCADCARGLIQSGISQIVSESKPDFDDIKWGYQFGVSQLMFYEAGVKTRFLS